MASASSFFSRAFSASRSFSRRASDTSMPPNFARLVQNDASLTACFLHGFQFKQES
jgi:L-asparagine transporter-like permease